uniref:Uncharacterized protein n=1 Tax=Oryza glumipatula TaxID=40148 RepID=A0A0E0A9K0_9ORYZ
MTYEVKSLIDQGNLPNYNSTQLNSRLTQRPYPATITQIHYHLTSDVGGVLQRRRAAAATSSGVGKRRRRRIRWRSTELRDDVEMTHQRRAADAGVEEERGKRRGRKRGSASGLYQRLRYGRKMVTTTARLPAAARSNGGGGCSRWRWRRLWKKGGKGAVADGRTAQALERRQLRIWRRGLRDLAARPARAQSAVAWAGDTERRRRPGRGGTWAWGLASLGL